MTPDWGWLRDRVDASSPQMAPGVEIDSGRYRGRGLHPILADLEPLPGFSALLGPAFRGCRFAQPPATLLGPSGAVFRKTQSRSRLQCRLDDTRIFDRAPVVPMGAIRSASVIPADAIKSSSPIIPIHANASAPVIPIRIPSANIIRSRHVDPGGV